MVNNMMVSTWMIRNMDLECLHGRMVGSMKVIGYMGNNMEEE